MNKVIVTLEDEKKSCEEKLRRLELELKCIQDSLHEAKLKETHLLNMVLKNNLVDIIHMIHKRGLKCSSVSNAETIWNDTIYKISDGNYFVNMFAEDGKIVLNYDGIDNDGGGKRLYNDAKTLIDFDVNPYCEKNKGKKRNNSMIKNIDGNLFDTKADIICHQANCQGRMGSGVALEVQKRYPEVFISYREDYVNGLLKLGYVNFAKNNKNQVIASMCGQQNYGYDGKKYTHYEELQKCMNGVKVYAKQNKLMKIAFPYLMSCHRGGGDWSIVSKMIEDTFGNFDVEIWKLDK